MIPNQNLALLFLPYDMCSYVYKPYNIYWTNYFNLTLPMYSQILFQIQTQDNISIPCSKYKFCTSYYIVLLFVMHFHVKLVLQCFRLVFVFC